MNRIRWQAVASILLVLTPVQPVVASQLAAHIYVALKARQRVPHPYVRKMLEDYESAYLAGACGPDIANTAHWAQVKLKVEAAGTEGHKLRTGQLVMNLLKHAKSSPDRDRATAFALGWLTHHQTDCLIHPLVNRYGGYYEVDPDRHMALEMVETEKVYQLAEKEDPTLSQFILNPGSSPRLENIADDVVIKAFATTYHDCPNAKQYNPMPGRLGDDGPPTLLPPDYLMHYRDNADNIMKFTRGTVAAHRQISAGSQSAVLVRTAGGPPPTTQEYERLMRPLVIDRVNYERAAGGIGYLVIEYTVNDARLFEQFIKDWEQEIGTAIHNCGVMLDKWSRDSDNFTVPDHNLDSGPNGYDGNKPSSSWPGNPTITKMFAEIKLIDSANQPVKLLLPDKRTAWQKSGEWVPCMMADATYFNKLPTKDQELINEWFGLSSQTTSRQVWYSPARQFRLKIPFEASLSGEYYCEIALKWIDPKLDRPYGVEAKWSDLRVPSRDCVLQLPVTVPNEKRTCFPFRPGLSYRTKVSSGFFGFGTTEVKTVRCEKPWIMRMRCGDQVRFFNSTNCVPYFWGMDAGKQKVVVTVCIEGEPPLERIMEFELPTRPTRQSSSFASSAASRPGSSRAVPSAEPGSRPRSRSSRSATGGRQLVVPGASRSPRIDDLTVSRQAYEELKSDGNAPSSKRAAAVVLFAHALLDYGDGSAGDAYSLLSEGDSIANGILSEPPRVSDTYPGYTYASQMASQIALCKKIGEPKAYQLARDFAERGIAQLRPDDRTDGAKIVSQILADMSNLAQVAANDLDAAIEYKRQTFQLKWRNRTPAQLAESEREAVAELTTLKAICVPASVQR